MIQIVAAAAVAAGLAAATAWASGSHPAAHLHLSRVRVTVGSVRVHGHRVTRLHGSFTVSNTGTAVSPRAVAWIGFHAGAHLTRAEDFHVPRLAPGQRVTEAVLVALPRSLAKRDWSIEACAVAGSRVTATPASGGCVTSGHYDTAPPVSHPVGAPTTTRATTATPPPPTTSTPSTTTPVSTVPSAPVTGYSPDTPFFEADSLGQYDGTANTASQQDSYSGGYFTSGYWVDVPPSYDTSNRTPETLLVWLHGCYGLAHDDDGEFSYVYSADRPYIVMAPNGPEAGGGTGPVCWDTSDQTDVSKVLLDIAQIETEFNIDRRRIIIAGYSSGGDLAYQTIFLHAKTFAGIIAINTNPVRDNTFGPNGIANAIAAAAWKFPIVQVSHDHDDIYHVDACNTAAGVTCDNVDPAGSTDPDVGVRPQITALQNAGFGTTLSVLAGNHYNDPTPDDNCTGYAGPDPCTGGTDYDIAHTLLAHIPTDGWEAPTS